MEVVLDKLTVASQLSRVGVEDENATRIEVVAETIVLDEIWARVADRNVQQPGIGI